MTPDPVLIKAIRELRRELKRVPDATREEKDGFIREKTGGKYGFSDYIKTVASIDTDAGSNVARSATSGALMHFADELAGVVGGEGNKEDYRLREEMYEGAHPKEALAANVAGSLGTGLAIPIAPAATALRSIFQGAGVGAAAGAADAAGRAEGTKERLEPAAKGAAVGGVAGGVLSGVLANLKLATSPRARAERRIRHAVKESGGVPALQKELDRHVAAGRGDEVMVGDLTDRMRREADFAANASDDVLVPLAKTVKDRQLNATDRLLQDAKELAGDANHVTRLEQLKAERRAWANEEFGKLREGGKNLRSPVTDGPEVKPMYWHGTPHPESVELADILNQPKVINAWRDAQEAGLIGKNIDLATPSIEKLQNVKFDLDDAVETAFRQGKGNLASRLKEANKLLVEAMEKRVPGYKALNAEYARRMRLEKALEDGAAAWGVNDSRQLAQQIKKLGPAEREEFRYGMASQLLQQLRNAQTNRDEAAKLMNASKTLQKKLEAVFQTKDQFDEFMRRVSSESDLAKMKGPVSGSETARRLASQGFDPAEIGINAATGGAANALVGAGAKMARGALARRTAVQEGPMLQMKGAPDIAKLLQAWQSPNPLLSRMVQNAFPTAMPQLW